MRTQLMVQSTKYIKNGRYIAKLKEVKQGE